jgi:hypothetical protein
MKYAFEWVKSMVYVKGLSDLEHLKFMFPYIIPDGTAMVTRTIFGKIEFSRTSFISKFVSIDSEHKAYEENIGHTLLIRDFFDTDCHGIGKQACSKY